MVNKVTIVKNLDNNIPVLLYQMKNSPSVSIGFYIKAGTLYEKAYNNGISHMIEHMLFKGTQKHSAYDIASQIDHTGGDINAYTSKECTGIYAKVLPEDCELPIRIISDMLMNSKLDEKEIEKEKSVIIEEIKSYEDSPEEINYDLLSQIIFKDTDYIHPILGTQESVNRINRDEIIKYMDEFYTPEHMVVSIAGEFDVEKVMNALNETIGQLKTDANRMIISDAIIENQSGFALKYKEFEQTHFDFAFWGPYTTDPLFYAAHIVNNIIAGTMSSRLFQKIREQQGLVYSIYSQISNYETAGNLTISLSLSEENLEKAVHEVVDELKKLKKESITYEEFEQSKKHLIGNMILNTETSDAYMSMLAKDKLFNRELKSVAQIIDEIKETTYDEAKEALNKILSSEKAISAIGKVEKNIIIDLYEFLKLSMEDNNDKSENSQSIE